MSTQAFSGKNGTAFKGADKICDLGKWSIEDTAAIAKFATNCTGGWKDGVSGVEDWKGTIEVKVQKNGRVQLAKGTRLSLKLHVDGTGSNYYSGTALISSRALEVDVNEGGEVSMTYNVEGVSELVGNGILAEGDAGCCGSSSGA